jgi:hypothetical protein
MPKDTRAAAHKRAREKAQQERQKQKQQRRMEAKERKDSNEASGNEDPDIAGIQPGPQPRPEWLDDLDSEESDAESAEPSQ